MRQIHRNCIIASVAFSSFLVSGCGGSGGSGGASNVQGETTTKANFGGLAVTYRSTAPLKPLTAGSSPVLVTGLGGGTITNLTFTPVPTLPQTNIVYNEGGEVTAYSLLTGTSAPLTTLTPNPATTSPSFSHDGRIIFYGLYKGSPMLLQMYADGSGLTGVATSANPPAKPAFSPLNNLIAYTTPNKLNIAQTNGTITATGASSYGGVQGIILLATAGSFTVKFNGQSTSAPYNVTPTQMQTAMNGLSNIGGVGGSVAVSSHISGQSNVFTIVFGGSLAGQNVPAITLDTTALTGSASAFESSAQVANERPAWSSDGTRIAALATMTAPYNAYSTGGYAIYQTNGVIKSFVPEAGYESLGSEAWSPDGAKLVFAANKSGTWDIIGHDLTSGLEWVVDDAAVTGSIDADPTISPDDKTVAFVKQTSPPAIWTASLSGANPAVLIKSATSALDHPDWMPFPVKKTFVGSGGPLGASASGFLLSQNLNGFGSLVAFTAKTPSTATVSAQGILGTAFLVKADSITSMSYANVYYGQPVSVIPGSEAASTQALVLFSLLTGKVTGVATISPKSPVSETRQGNTVTYSGHFLQVWNAAGQMVAPKGASRIDVDASGERPRVR